MKDLPFALGHPQATVTVPDSIDSLAALERTTHLGIGAHPDDLEFMCWHPILECFDKGDSWFGGIIASDGRASPRLGRYADIEQAEMAQVRLKEQKHAAISGEYSVVVNLMYPELGRVMEAEGVTPLVEDLKNLIGRVRPKAVYTHNIMDKHRHHVLVSFCVVKALRELGFTPERFLGCEVWRGLDWLPDGDKVTFDVSAHQNLTNSLMGVYDSQISGGKRYDLATAGRKRTNATYFDPYHPDEAELLEFAVDLMPLLADPNMTPVEYARQLIGRFESEVVEGLEKLC